MFRSPGVWSCVLPVFLAASSAAHGQETVSQSIAERTINLIVPKGFCVLDRGSREGRGWYGAQEQMNKGRNSVLLIYVDCRELRIFQRDLDAAPKSHGSYLAPLTQGRLSALPAQYTRARIISEMKRAFPKVSKSDVENVVSNRMRELDFDKDLQMSGLQMGYLAEDDAAVYVGVGSRLQAGGEKVRVIGVLGFTLVSSVLVSSNLYSVAGPNENFSTLLPRQKALMQLLVSRN